MDGDISEKLNEILSDPKKLSAVMGAVGSIMGQKNEEEHVQSDDGKPELSKEALKSLIPRSDGHSDERVKLLVALKPFLDEDRCGRVDKLIRVFSLASIAGQLKDFM